MNSYHNTFLKGICHRLNTMMFLLSLSLTLFASNLLGQTEDIKRAIESVARYNQSGFDQVTPMLEQTGFKVPQNLKAEWTNYPEFRKISYAWRAAEAAEPGVGGQKVLTALTNQLNDIHESVPYDRVLNQHLNKNFDGKIKFATPELAERVKLPTEIGRSVRAVSRYVESGALGGVSSILKHHFNLPDAQVYDILEKSSSAEQALERGLNNAKNPPPPKQRLHDLHTEADSLLMRYRKLSDKAAELEIERQGLLQQFGKVKSKDLVTQQKIEKQIEGFVKRKEKNEADLLGMETKLFYKYKDFITWKGGHNALWEYLKTEAEILKYYAEYLTRNKNN